MKRTVSEDFLCILCVSNVWKFHLPICENIFFAQFFENFSLYEYVGIRKKKKEKWKKHQQSSPDIFIDQIKYEKLPFILFCSKEKRNPMALLFVFRYILLFVFLRLRVKY